MTKAEQQELIDELVDALEIAQEHLDYCGYGDSWERECAEAQGIENKIEKALLKAGKQL